MTNIIVYTPTTGGGFLLNSPADSLTVLASGSIVAPADMIDGTFYTSQSVSIQGYVDVDMMWLAGQNHVAIGATGTFVGHGGVAMLLGANFAMDTFTGGTSMVNQGTIRGTGDGIALYGSGNTLINSGTITADGVAIATNPTLYGSGSRIFNSGMIQSTSNYAVDLKQDGDMLTNSGSLVSGAAVTVFMEGAVQSIMNTGLIEGRWGAITAFGTLSTIVNEGDIRTSGTIQGGNSLDGGAIVFGAAVGTGIVNNTGHVHGSLAGIVAVDDTTLLVTNKGTIEGLAVGIATANPFGPGSTSYSGPSVIHNSGTISGLYASLALGDGGDTVVNTGTLEGNVYLGAGDDLIDTRHGTVTGTPSAFGGNAVGTITGGDGSDTYLIGEDNVLLVEGTGLVGNIDTVKSTASYQLEANFETLTLLGGHAINGAGNAGNNRINGNSGDNRLSGLWSADVLYGNMGDDRLLGGAGTDWLNGGDGDDALVGGAGKDWMTGGADSDSFIFLTSTNTGTTEATADVISGFVSGEDVIDLGHIDANRSNVSGNDAFTFIGTDSFSGVAGQVHCVALGANTLVEFDTNGDSVADGVIKLIGTIGLHDTDFVL